MNPYVLMFNADTDAEKNAAPNAECRAQIINLVAEYANPDYGVRLRRLDGASGALIWESEDVATSKLHFELAYRLQALQYELADRGLAMAIRANRPVTAEVFLSDEAERARMPVHYRLKIAMRRQPLIFDAIEAMSVRPAEPIFFLGLGRLPIYEPLMSHHQWVLEQLLMLRAADGSRPWMLCIDRDRVDLYLKPGATPDVAWAIGRIVHALEALYAYAGVEVYRSETLDRRSAAGRLARWYFPADFFDDLHDASLKK